MLVGGLMSGVLSNTGTAAVLIPVVIGIPIVFWEIISNSDKCEIVSIDTHSGNLFEENKVIIK